MASGDRRDARSLVNDLLKSGPAPDPAIDKNTADSTSAAPELSEGAGVAAGPHEGTREDAEAIDLINVYFELEEPEERDVCFDELVALRSPLVQDFLRAVMEQDKDEYLRAAAAGELARRGDPSAAATLSADLEDPEDPFFFEHAVQVLAEIGGAAFYDRLAQIWRDPERDSEQRCTAMLGMETADTDRALADFVTMIRDIDDIAAMQDDQVEAAITAFVRHDHGEAVAGLVALRGRIQAAELDAEDRRELVGLVQEGIDLLAAE